MNRSELQQLAEIRLRDAKALLVTGENDAGAYYMAGYAVECALKAVIAKKWVSIVLDWSQDQLVDAYPERNNLILNKQEFYTHNIRQLYRIAGLSDLLRIARENDRVLDENWKIVESWSEESRYIITRSHSDSEELVNAVEDRTRGVLLWIEQYY